MCKEEFLSQEDANELLNNIGVCWLKNDNDIAYLAVVKNDYCECEKCYYLEKGILDRLGNLEKKPIHLNNIPEDCLKLIEKTKINTKNYLKQRNTKIDNKTVQEIVLQNQANTIIPYKIRPLMAGIQISNGATPGKTGTLGALVSIENYKNDVFILTNYHVVNSRYFNQNNEIFQPKKNAYLKPENAKSIGDTLFARFGGITKDNFDLDVAFIKLKPKKVLNQEKSKKPTFYCSGSIFNEPINKIKANNKLIKGTHSPKIGMKVHLHGWKSGIKDNGTIRSTNAMVKIKDIFKYPVVEKLEIRPKETSNLINDKGELYHIFRQQVMMTNISNSGDSGAVVIDSNTDKVIGLHFAGDGKNVSFSNNIDHILEAEYQAEDKKLINVKINKFIS